MDEFMRAAIAEAEQGLEARAAFRSVRCWCTTAGSSAAATTVACRRAARCCTAKWTPSRTPAVNPPRSIASSVIYTTLSPCAMCSGAILLYGIRHVIVGENQTFMGEELLLRERGVESTSSRTAPASA